MHQVEQQLPLHSQSDNHLLKTHHFHPLIDVRATRLIEKLVGERVQWVTSNVIKHQDYDVLLLQPSCLQHLVRLRKRGSTHGQFSRGIPPTHLHFKCRNLHGLHRLDACSSPSHYSRQSGPPSSLLLSDRRGVSGFHRSNVTIKTKYIGAQAHLRRQTSFGAP